MPLFSFGEFELDPALRQLRRAGTPVTLGPKPMTLLLYLVENRARVVTHQELKQKIWPEQPVVEDGALRQIVREARRALEGEKSTQPWLRNVRGFGYRFDASGGVQEKAPPPNLDLEPPSARELLLEQEEGEFLDREREMARLRAALKRALDGERQTILLNGPPGIGKTRTALELAREAAQRGFDVHAARCQDRRSGAPPYWPWVQLLRSWSERHGREALESEVPAPELASLLLDQPVRPPAPLAEDRFRLFDEAARFLHAASHRQPVLVVFDDLHLADEDSLALLLFLCRDLRRAPLLIAGTHRDASSFADGTRARALQEALGEPSCSGLTLRGLARSSVERILERALSHPPSDQLGARTYEITGGNPLFVAEITRLIASQGEAVVVESARVPISEGLRDAVLARVAECSDPCRTLLDAACTIGEACTLPLLQRMLAIPEATLLPALSEAESRELLCREGSAGRYRFVHGVVRDTLYGQLDGARSMLLHRAAGEALLELHGDGVRPPLAQLAHHFVESAAIAAPQRAVDCARRAAEQASLAYAYEDAVTLYDQAFQALEFLYPPDPHLRCTLLVEFGEALMAAHQPVRRTREVFGKALELARLIGSRELLARAALGSVGYLSLKRNLTTIPTPRRDAWIEELLPLLEEAQQGLLDGGSPALRHRVLVAHANLLLQSSQPERATPLLKEVLRFADERTEPGLRADALVQQCIQSALLDRPDERRAITEELGRLCERELLRSPRSALLVCRASDGLECGDRAAADAAGAELVRLADDRHMVEALPLACAWRSLSAQLDGRLEEALFEAQEGARRFAQLNHGPEVRASVFGLQSWWISLLQGTEEALIPDWEVAAHRLNDHPTPRLLLARLYVAVGRLDDARRELARVDPGQLSRAPAFLACASLFGELASLLDERDRAARAFELLWPHRRRCVTVGAIVLCTGSASRPLGSVAARLGRTSEAIELFEHALASAQSLRSPALQAWTQLDYGEALLRHPADDERARAHALLEKAQKTAQELSLYGVATRARRACA